MEASAPGEGGSGASEALSENAKQRFAASQQQSKQQQREEKKARKRDDRVAQTIRQFLGDDQYAHLFQLISRLAARDCPSIFILALLSLIHKGAREAVEEYIAEQHMVVEPPDTHPQHLGKETLPKEIREILILWTARLALVLSLDTEKILSRLMVDEGNIDGTVLQLTTFVLVDFFANQERPVAYDKLQPLTVKILQDIIEPYIDVMEKYFAKLKEETEGSKEDGED